MGQFICPYCFYSCYISVRINIWSNNFIRYSLGASAISNKEDEYDDIGNSIAQEIRNNPETDKYMVVEVTFDENGKPDVYSYLKEE